MKTVLISIALVVICMMQYGDAQITGWTEPNIANAADGTGALSLAENQAVGATTTTYDATPTVDGAAVTYTLEAGTPFSIASDTGVLSLDSALDFETTPSYTLKITATEAGDAAKTGLATITVTVTDVDFDPVFASTQYAATVPDASSEGTAVTTVMATDVEGDAITYSLTSTDFSIDVSSGAITVKTGVTLDASTLAGYTLTVTATDGGGNADTTTVGIAVSTCSSGSVLVVASMITLLAALLTTVL